MPKSIKRLLYFEYACADMPRLIGCLAAALLLAGCGGSAAAPSTLAPSASAAANAPASAAASAATALRFATNGQVPSSTWIWLMGDAGVFAKNGLNVQLQAMTGQASTNAMVGGDVDAELHNGVALVLSAEAGGAKFKIVADMQPVYDQQIVVPDAITAPEQLKGKKVGSQTSTSANVIATEHYLGQHGLTQGTDYTVVQTGSAGSEGGMVAALLSHQVDAIAVTPTAADQVLAQGGYHVLIDLAKTDVRVANQIVVVQQSLADQHPDTVQKLVDSMISGVRYFREHKAEAETAMKVHFKLTDQAAMDKLYQRQVEILTNLPKVDKADFADVVATMPKNGPQLSDAQLSAMLDNRYVEDAAKRGLTNF
jgi:ABC-type nitrate/sulfonate/bicarbonate transport system substrate-binding protein